MGKQAEAVLLQRIANWKAAFNDDVTGIQKAIDDLPWDYAAFQTAIGIVRLAAQRQRVNDPDSHSASLNQMLFELLAKGYWFSLLPGARKLLDAAQPLVGSRGVYSFRAVLNDVKACQPKLTRRTYVECVRMCRYDLRTLKEEQYEALKAAAGKPVWGDPALTLSEFAHRDFDYFSRVKEEDRSEGDLIDLAVLDSIEKRLAQLDRISEHATTHLAHAGNAESRIGKSLEEFDIRDARAVLKSLKEIGDLTGLRFANASISTLAVYQGNQFEALDVAAVAKADMPELETNWRRVEEDIASWRLDPHDLLSVPN